MKIKYLGVYILTAIVTLLMMSSVQAGTPLWTFTPLTATSITVPANGSATVQYQLTNQSNTPHTLVMQPIQGVTQLTSGSGICNATSTLATKGASCVLSLQVNGDQLTGNIHGGPVVCQQGSNIQCYQPAQANILNVILGSPSTEATIIVSGSPLSLTANGPTGNLVITNTSSLYTAINITSDFSGTALQGNVTETGNTCNAVAPGDSCTLTYTPGNNLVSQTNFPIQGSNTNSATAAIEINAIAPSLSSIAPVSGSTAGGTSITLTGTDLTDTSAVTLGGIAATSVNVINSTTVTAITPAHAAGAVDVTITTPGGGATLLNGYTYEEPPTISGIAPSSGSASGDNGVTVTGTNLTGTTGITFGGVAATAINVINSTSVTAVTPAHASGVVDVDISTPVGTATMTNGYTYLTTAVGQSASGGTIACLSGGLNNLIAAVADNSSSIVWGGAGTSTNAQSDTDGATNTAAIINALGANGGTPYAAQLCNNYEVDSQGNSPCQVGNTCYTGWFLPAKDQLNCLYTNRVAIGGFVSAPYWSSTEFTAVPTLFAWQQDFSSGTQSASSKSISHNIRCVKSFTP